MFSILIIFVEFSPYILENYLVHSFPWFSSNNGKALFYLILSSFLFDAELNFLSHISACLLLAAGLGWLLHEYLESPSDAVPKFTRPSNNTSGVSIGSTSTSQVNRSNKINFNKYLSKRPKYERDFQESQPMQELGSYRPPLTDSEGAKSTGPNYQIN